MLCIIILKSTRAFLKLKISRTGWQCSLFSMRYVSRKLPLLCVTTAVHQHLHRIKMPPERGGVFFFCKKLILKWSTPALLLWRSYWVFTDRLTWMGVCFSRQLWSVRRFLPCPLWEVSAAARHSWHPERSTETALFRKSHVSSLKKSLHKKREARTSFCECCRWFN